MDSSIHASRIGGTPTNHFSKNEKKTKRKLKSSKIKKNISPNRPPPQAHMLSRYNFFKKYAHFHLAVVERSLLKNCRYANNLNLLHLAVVERPQTASSIFSSRTKTLLVPCPLMRSRCSELNSIFSSSPCQ